MAHVVIDGRRLDSSTQNYGRSLLKYLEKIDSDNQYTVITLPTDKRWQPSKPNFKILTTEYDNYTFGEQLGLWRLIKSLKPDLVHFLMPQQPLLYRGKRITTVHDLTLVHFQNLDKNKLIYTIEQTIFKFLLKNVVRRSEFVITPTEYVKEDLVQYSGISPDKVMVTLESVDPIDDPAEPVAALQDKPFLFQVSNAFPYKNLQLLVEAFKELKADYPDLQLALAGKKEFFYEQLEAKAKADGVRDVHFLGFVSEGEKRWLYENAAAHVNPSRSEGFGLQCLEAMLYKAPMVVSSATCLPEVADNTALYFDPDDKDELVRQIKKVLNNDPIVSENISRYKKRLETFSWQKMAKETHNLYQQALK
ncbi:MAG: glycosyltransferase family 1 protein [Candidatus Saccharimonadales bacterium]|nr:glycosyltransferase family 1 protein [Candidatus Saccharimonadales bacterium]